MKYLMIVYNSGHFQGYTLLSENVLDEEIPTFEKLWERIVDGMPTGSFDVYLDNDYEHFRSREEYLWCFRTFVIDEPEYELLKLWFGNRRSFGKVNIQSEHY